jgi:Calx-beta domain/Neocarzinostatin family
MRRIVTGISLAALTLALVAPGSLAHAATATPTLTIDTPTPLEDLASVTVTGAGLTPGETLAFMECQHYGDLCTYRSGVSGTVDGSGRLTLTATAHRYIHDYMYVEPVIDCAYEDCGFALVRLGDYEDGYLVIAETVGHFAATTPAAPTVRVEAAAPLPAAVSTRLLGSGFVPGSTVLSSRCLVSPPDSAGRVGEDCQRSESAIADASGDVAIPIELRRLSVDRRDCTDPVWRCSVRLDGPAYGATARAALVFDPTSVPPPVPTVTVTPAAGLGVGGTVHVRGTGLRPGEPVWIEQCTSDQLRCARDVEFAGLGVSTTADAAGTFDVVLRLRRYILNDLEPVIDCARPRTCAIEVHADPLVPIPPVPLDFAVKSGDPTISFDGAIVVEGTGPTPTTANVLVHLDRPSTHRVRFRWYPYYTDVLGGIEIETIPPGVTHMTFPVQVRADAEHEPFEITHQRIWALEGAQIDPAHPDAPIGIIDDDPEPSITVRSVTVAENDPRHEAIVVVTLSNPSSTPVTVRYRTRHASARSGRDFERTRGTATIGTTFTNTYVHVSLIDDARPESTESFRIEFSHRHGARSVTRRVTVTIHDDD